MRGLAVEKIIYTRTMYNLKRISFEDRGHCRRVRLLRREQSITISGLEQMDMVGNSVAW